MASLQRTEARRDLAQFVRDRRGRTRPQDVGLDPGERRRTPGLRREEVAQIVGVSVTWYTWFEQGRDIQVSTRFLNGVCDALRLNPAERATLFELAQHPPPSDPASAAVALPALQALAANQEYKPPAVPGLIRAVVAVRTPPDPEAHRLNQAIRRIIASEEERGPPPAVPIPAPAPGMRRSVRWSIAMTVLGVLMLMPVSAVS